MDHTIEPGTSVSHYRIISAIGAGGMGQVYKAQDLTLDRTVALKVLPNDLVRNDERVRRFVQEAKSASSLNHPNIVTIHEIGQSVASSTDGTPAADAHPIHFIAMELIDGSTLKKKIYDGSTDLRTLLGYFAQAAEGLAKAHAAGIVHRDLKPENVMITRDGFAKVLDFGLAKLSVKQSATESMSTAVREATREGTILGTVGYMSPEQVRGQVVDHRSDIFSFGCMLYEAAARRRPFEADSDVDVMHKILHEKPVAIDETNPLVPAEVRRMIRRCLAKDPERRYQSMKDLAIELADVVDEFEELSASAASRSSGSLSQPLAGAPRPRVTVVAVVAALAVLALAAVGINRWRTRAADAKKVSVAYGSMKIDQLTTTNRALLAAVSPDGKYVALVNSDSEGRFSLSVLQVATKATAQIVAPMRTPFVGITFSPDSNYLLYTNAEQESGSGYSSLYQVPSLGGTPQRIVFDVDSAITYSPDGKQFAFTRGHPDLGENWIIIASADGSSERKLIAYKRVYGRLTPAWSPDGKTIVTALMQMKGGIRFELAAIDVATGAQRIIGKQRWANISSATWLPDGKAIVLTGAADFTSRSQVWLQPYPDGDPVHITNDLNQYEGVTVTSDGSTIALVRRERDMDLVAAVPSQTTAPTPLVPHSSNEYETVSAAQNGLVAVTAMHENGSDVAAIDPGSGRLRFLTHDGTSVGPMVSADGRTIVFTALRGGNLPHIFITDSDGGAVRQLTQGDGEAGPSISDDGTFVTYNSLDGTIWRVGTGGGTPVRLAKMDNAFPYHASPISRDGKMFFYPLWRSAGARVELRLIVADVQSGTTITSIPWAGKGRGVPRWSHLENAVLFPRQSGGVGNLYALPFPSGEPKELTNFTDSEIVDFDQTGDGRLVIARGKTRSDVVTIRDFR